MSAAVPLPPLAPAPDDLDWLDGLEEGVRENADLEAWEIEGMAHAEVLMRRLRRLRRREKEVIEQAQEWRQPIEEWESAELARLSGPIGWYEERLRTYALLLRERNDRAKTLRVPSGEVPTRRSKEPKISIDDPDVVIEWACNELQGGAFDEVIDTRFAVKVAEMKHRLGVVPVQDAWCTVCGCELVEPAEGEDGPWLHLGAGEYDHDAAPGERLTVVFRRVLEDESIEDVEMPGVSAEPPRTTAPKVNPNP